MGNWITRLDSIDAEDFFSFIHFHKYIIKESLNFLHRTNFIRLYCRHYFG